MDDTRDRLAVLKERSLLRFPQVVEHRAGNSITISNKIYINFSSNDYLGLSLNPAAQLAAQKAIQAFGVGSTASRLICGTTSLHIQAELALAKLKKREAALLLPSGYMANIALITTITTKTDVIIMDRLVHASLFDAAKLSGARLLIYQHNDMADLTRILKRYRSKYKKAFIATEAVFSMDGDIAPLPELLVIAATYRCQLIIDEAHSTGVLGHSGAGIEEHFGIAGSQALLIGTCSKAIGVQGGFIAASQDIIDLLTSTGRAHMYTTGIAPGLCAAITENVKAISAPFIEQYQTKLELFRNLLAKAGIPGSDSKSAIFPIIIGENQTALDLTDQLKDKNIFAVAIREPTVPAGTARLRITINALHTEKEINDLVDTLKGTKIWE